MATSKEMKWGITGGSGQLARSLVDLLSTKSIEHIAWSRAELDITDSSCITSIGDYRPDILVNCAAWTNVDGAEDAFEDALKVNRDGARNAAVAAKELNIPLIHVSTDYVFSGSGSTPWNVDHTTQPTSKYGLSKLLGEERVQEIWPEKSYIVRTAWLYGAYGKNFAKTILKKAIGTNDLIYVVNDQTGQPTTTSDVADRIFAIAESQVPTGIYHATNSGQASWWEFARELVELSHNDVTRVVPVDSKQFQTKANRPKFSVLDHSKWGKVGFQPMRDWRSALIAVFPEIEAHVMKELSK